MPEQLPEMRLLVAGVRSVLDAESRGTVAPHSATTHAASAPMAEKLLEAVSRHRVESVLAPHATALGFAPSIVDGIIDADRSGRMAAMMTVADTVRVSMLLSQSEVPHLIVKGAPLSVQTTGSPFARRSGDVDVLVAPADVTRAMGALVDTGMQRNSDSPGPESPLFALSQRTAKEMLLWQEGHLVDLHWRLDQARASLNWSTGELLDAAEWIPLGDRHVPTLSPMHAAILNGAHGSNDAWSRLRLIVDHERLTRAMDPAELIAEAVRAGASRRVAIAESMVARLSGRGGGGSGSRLAQAQATMMWRWMLAGVGSGPASGPQGAARAFTAHVLAYDHPRAAAQRIETLLLPVEAMTRREFGDVGDSHPWLYRAAAPYFLPKRVLSRRLDQAGPHPLG